MFMKKITVFCAVLVGIITSKAVDASSQAIPAHNFKGKFSKQFGLSAARGQITLEQLDGTEVLKIRQDAKRYYAAAAIRLNDFNGTDGIFVGVDVKTVDIEQFAGVYYYWIDTAGKKLTQERFLAKVSGSSEWSRYEKIVSSPKPLKTAGINIGFALYSPKGSKTDGYVLYRNPVIRVAKSQDSESVKKTALARKKKRKAAIKPTPESFNCRFTNKLRGVSFDVERGGFGWFMLWAKQRLQGLKTLKISAPKAIDFELYLAKGGKAAWFPCKTTIKNGIKTSVFANLNNVRWNCWMNVLIFKAGNNVPKKFDLSMTFCDSSGKAFFTEKIPVKILEPLKLAPSGSSFENRVYYAHPFRWIDFNDKRAKLANELLDYLKSRGFTSAGYLVNAKKQPFAVEKGEVITNFGRLPYRFNNSKLMTKLLKKYNIPMAMNIGGARSGSEIETQAVINNGVSFFNDTLEGTGNKEYLNRELVWINDYEPYAFEGPALQYSFAPESLAAFRKFIGLADKTKLTPRMVAEKYEKQWVKFRCFQHAEVIKAQYKALKKFCPQAIYALSSESLPGSNENPYDFFKQFGVDLKMMDAWTDLHLPMIYSRTTLYYNRLEACTRQLKKPVMPTITCGYGNSIRDPKRLTKIMVGSAFLDAPGVYHWPGFWGMDANELQSCQRAMALISRLEPYFKATKLLDRKNYVSCRDAKVEDFYYAVRGNAGEYLIFLVNDDKNKNFYPKVILPDAAVPLYVAELIGNKTLSSGSDDGKFSALQLKKGFHVKLPPDSIKLLRFSPQAHSGSGDAIDAATMKKEYDAALKKQKSMNRGAEKNGMYYKRVNDILVVSTPVQQVSFQMNNCAVGKWELIKNGKTLRLLNFFGIDQFDYPAGFRIKDIPAELEKIELKKDEVVMSVYYKVKDAPYDGLAFRRKLVIFRDKPEIKVQIDIIPASGFRQFALREVNGVNISGSSVFVDDKAISSMRSGSNGGNIFTRNNTKFTPYLKSKHIKECGNFRTNSCVLQLPSGLKVKIEFSNKVKALLNWYNIHNMDTVELIFDKAFITDDPHQIQTWSCAYTLKALTK